MTSLSNQVKSPRCKPRVETTMKKFALFLICIVSFSLPASAADRIVISSGPEGSGSWNLGVEISSRAGKNSAIDFVVLPSSGDGENLARIEAGTADLAIVDVFSLSSAPAGGGRFSPLLVCVIGFSTEHVVLFKNLVETYEIADVSGKTIYIGKAGDPKRGAMRELLRAFSVEPGAFSGEALPSESAAELIIYGAIDGAIISAPLPSKIITRLTERMQGGISLLSIPELSPQDENSPLSLFWPALIPAGTYPHQEEPIPTLHHPIILLSSKDTSPKTIELILKGLFGETGSFSSQCSIDAVTIDMNERLVILPFHPGAASFFAERGVSVRSR